MTWKFWTWWRRSCAVCRKHLEDRDRWRRAAMERDAEVTSLEATLAHRAKLIEILQRGTNFKQRPAADQPTEPQILSALCVVDESTPLWRAVHRLLDLLEQDQKAAVCNAAFDGDQRHFNAGRLAMCEDLRDSLLQKWAEAKRENEESAR